jgi:hypothetical protein
MATRTPIVPRDEIRREANRRLTKGQPPFQLQLTINFKAGVYLQLILDVNKYNETHLQLKRGGGLESPPLCKL